MANVIPPPGANPPRPPGYSTTNLTLSCHQIDYTKNITLAFHPVIPIHVSEVRLEAGEPAAGPRGLDFDIHPLQGLETWVVTSDPRMG